MCQYLNKIINKLERYNIPICVFILETAAVGGLRFWIEGIAYHYFYNFIIFYQAISYYIFIFSFVLMITVLITKEKVSKITSAFSFFVPVILIAPILDHFILGRTKGYPYPTSSTWFTITFSFFERYVLIPSHGYQLEFGILLFMLSIYIYSKLKYQDMARKILVTSSTIFLVYILILILSTPDFSPIIQFIYISDNSGLITYNFYYYVLIFRYLLLTSIFLFIIALAKSKSTLLMFSRSDLSFGFVLSPLIYLVGFYMSAFTLNFSSVPGRINWVILSLGLIGTFWTWVFVVSTSKSYKKANTLFGEKIGRISISSKYFLSLSILSAIFSIITILPIGPSPTYTFIAFLIFITLYFAILNRNNRPWIKSLVIGFSVGLLFYAAYNSPQFTTHYEIDFNFIISFIIITIAIATIQYFKSRKKINDVY